jgi:hypothetical protein
MSPDKSEHVTKSGDLLAIPGRLCHWNVPIRMQGLPKEGHETVEAKKQRSRAFDSSIRPLALRLDAQMGTSLFKGDLQTPALHEIANDLFCRLGEVGGKNGLVRTPAQWITSELCWLLVVSVHQMGSWRMSSNVFSPLRMNQSGSRINKHSLLIFISIRKCLLCTVFLPPSSG